MGWVKQQREYFLKQKLNKNTNTKAQASKEPVNVSYSTDAGVMGAEPENIKKTKRENLFNNPSNTFGN